MYIVYDFVLAFSVMLMTLRCVKPHSVAIEGSRSPLTIQYIKMHPSVRDSS